MDVGSVATTSLPHPPTERSHPHISASLPLPILPRAAQPLLWVEKLTSTSSQRRIGSTGERAAPAHRDSCVVPPRCRVDPRTASPLPLPAPAPIAEMSGSIGNLLLKSKSVHQRQAEYDAAEQTAEARPRKLRCGPNHRPIGGTVVCEERDFSTLLQTQQQTPTQPPPNSTSAELPLLLMAEVACAAAPLSSTSTCDAAPRPVQPLRPLSVGAQSVAAQSQEAWSSVWGASYCGITRAHAVCAGTPSAIRAIEMQLLNAVSQRDAALRRLTASQQMCKSMQASLKLVMWRQSAVPSLLALQRP